MAASMLYPPPPCAVLQQLTGTDPCFNGRRRYSQTPVCSIESLHLDLLAAQEGARVNEFYDIIAPTSSQHLDGNLGIPSSSSPSSTPSGSTGWTTPFTSSSDRGGPLSDRSVNIPPAIYSMGEPHDERRCNLPVQDEHQRKWFE